MRIALLVRRFDPSGGSTERDMAAAADRLSRAGHRVRIYAARGQSQFWHEMPVRRLPLPGFRAAWKRSASACSRREWPGAVAPT